MNGECVCDDECKANMEAQPQVSSNCGVMSSTRMVCAKTDFDPKWWWVYECDLF